MASAPESDSSQDEESLSSADADLWALLPRKFRADFGSEGGQLPDVGLLAFLFADRHDLCAVMTDYVPGDRKLRTTAVRAFTALQQRALPGAQRRNKRRGRTDPAWQKVALARRLAPADGSAGALDTVSWPFKRSGARRRQSAWPTRAAKKLADSKLGLTRAAIEKAELQRWRDQLVELVLQAKTPMAQQAQLASNPQATVSASLGSMWPEWKRRGAMMPANA